MDRSKNLSRLITTAKMLEIEGFTDIPWEASEWKITEGRLIEVTGKNTSSTTLKFLYPPKIYNEGLIDKKELIDEWANVAKALFLLRLHRKNQTVTNHRQFITAIGYVAYAADTLSLTLSNLTPEALDLACSKISEHYAESSAYNSHKAVAEFARHCDENDLCRCRLDYRYSKMKRPDNTGGIGHERLDDPGVVETSHEKIIAPKLFKILGALYLNVPKDHKYRLYVLILTLLACLGRRFTEIVLLPYQQVMQSSDGRSYIEYFPRKTFEGDLFTPLRKLYFPTDVVPIVNDVVSELGLLCKSPRETAAEMHRAESADLRFLENVDADCRLYSNDLEKYGLSKSLLVVNGWLRKHGYAYPDYSKLTKQGFPLASPMRYTTKDGVTQYCKTHFNKSYLRKLHCDQNGKEYFHKDLLIVRALGLSGRSSANWVSTQCTHSMFSTFLRYLPGLAKSYASADILVDFTSHHFRHTLNTLLDEGGLSDLLQTEWFGRSNDRDTKAYQHTSREKRALMIRDDLKKGVIGGILADQISALPVSIQDAVLKNRVQAVHDVGTGVCVHNFSQLPCERHLQCSADCGDYLWAKDDAGRLDDLKRQYALAVEATGVANERMSSKKPKKSSAWLVHLQKKLRTLSMQLKDNGVENFDAKAYLRGLENA